MTIMMAVDEPPRPTIVPVTPARANDDPFAVNKEFCDHSDRFFQVFRRTLAAIRHTEELLTKLIPRLRVVATDELLTSKGLIAVTTIQVYDRGNDPSGTITYIVDQDGRRRMLLGIGGASIDPAQAKVRYGSADDDYGTKTAVLLSVHGEYLAKQLEAACRHLIDPSDQG